jgi:uncharacterized membrane protein (UPF0136 family)
MAKLTIVFGLLLILLGLVGYYGTGHIHPTALIPAGFGLLLAIFGFLANTEDTRKKMLFMHIAVTLGLLGFLATAAAILQEIQLLQGKVFPFPSAVESKAAMSIICLIFVLLCVRSFIAARRARAQA